MPPIQEIDYKLLYSAAREAEQRPQDELTRLGMNQEIVRELYVAIRDARMGYPTNFVTSPNQVALAYRILETSTTFSSHPNAAQTLNVLRPIASQSTWARHAAGSSGIFGKPEAFTGRPTATPTAGMGGSEPLVGGVEVGPTNELKTAYDRVRATGEGATEFRTVVEKYLAVELGRRPSEAEVLSHLTENREGSKLSAIRRLTGASEAEFAEVVAKAREAGALLIRARVEVREGKVEEKGRGPRK